MDAGESDFPRHLLYQNRPAGKTDIPPIDFNQTDASSYLMQDAHETPESFVILIIFFMH